LAAVCQWLAGAGCGKFDAMSDQPDFAGLLETADLADLGPGPRQGVQTPSILQEQLKPLFKASDLPHERQELIRALVFLWHDHLDAAHTIAQSIDNADGAFVHGIMHRREPDSGNAAYWFRRVGRHPAFARIASDVTARLNSVSGQELASNLVRDGAWNPFAFINACASAPSASESTQRLLRQIQKVEFNALLDLLARY
jgi:hypothetical protein